jgi:hypothetical protein
VNARENPTPQNSQRCSFAVLQDGFSLGDDGDDVDDDDEGCSVL